MVKVADGSWIPAGPNAEIEVPFKGKPLAVYVKVPGPSGHGTPAYEPRKFEVPGDVYVMELKLRSKIADNRSPPVNLARTPATGHWPVCCSELACGGIWIFRDCSDSPCCFAMPTCGRCTMDGLVPAIAVGDASGSFGDASLTVLVPQDALVFINGWPTRSIGTRRLYTSGGLARGYSYPYVVCARVLRDGKIVEQTRELFLHADESKTVTIDFPAAGKVPAVPSPQ